jgi:hypothetical protein
MIWQVRFTQARDILIAETDQLQDDCKLQSKEAGAHYKRK